ncbi:MAG: hypothetical protein ABJE95_17025 [Byssovorax sp.]
MKREASRAWIGGATVVVAGLGAAFWGAGIARTGGAFPVPLDDVYIHFGFARSAALGHPFEWIPGNGYSSGGTSLIYPLVLAPAWAVGFRGARLAIFAALLAVACVVDLGRSIRDLLARTRAPGWIAAVAPALIVAVPLVDWSLFSGMETALFAAILGRALVATERAGTSALPGARARAQLVAGVWGALMIATRPESAPLALLLGLASAYGARSLPLAASLGRSLGPSVIFLGGQAGVNLALTGEIAAAGAVRKLLGSNPYVTPLEIAGEVIKNLVALREAALSSALGGPLLSWIVPLLGVVATIDRRSRRLAIPLMVGAYSALLLVSLNSTARFQNLRYAVPTLLMLLAAAALGIGAIARLRWGGVVAVAALAAAVIAPAKWFPKQIDHFARSSGNIEEQQAEVARRLAAEVPRRHRVLVGDAGAIPYLSGLDAIDGLGLGGYRGMPFARASVHGIPAVVELIERLPANERPDVMALYPSWWKGLTDGFGKRDFSVKIQDNVICAADEKVVYTPDWSSLADPGETRSGAVDELDVADLVEEKAHRYEVPAPRGGWVIGAVLADPAREGKSRFDAGRIVPEGRHDAFVVDARVARRDAVLIFRTNGGGAGVIRVEIERAGRGVVGSREVAIPARAEDRWSEVRVGVEDVGAGDRVVTYAVSSAFASFHVWLVRE